MGKLFSHKRVVGKSGDNSRVRHEVQRKLNYEMVVPENSDGGHYYTCAGPCHERVWGYAFKINGKLYCLDCKNKV